MYDIQVGLLLKFGLATFLWTTLTLWNALYDNLDLQDKIQMEET